VQLSFTILPYDEAAALRHAAERARLERAGSTIPFVDGQIAAIALVNDLVLVTGNLRDFAAFTTLQVENWAQH
jgi:tRNA(fMet)-specific endonuclease VapC